ncbi:hypothetical protein NQ318_001943 [Aromia moschata]|uniref:Cytochrome P450 n=1 Tax=Aromia moschata TaxID=1265417 RepID=A0AAV8Z462_9CUCU|nr:hypothetical protein NQ318_001943 [Aromia moschata]
MALITSTAFGILLLVTTLAISIYAYFHWSYTYWKKRKCPFLPPKFPLGNSTSFLTKTSNFTLETYRFYNEIKKRGLKFAGIYTVTRPVLVVIDPDYIRDILSKDFQYFVNRGSYHNEKNDPLSAHLFNIDEPKWKPLRSKLTPHLYFRQDEDDCSRCLIDAMDRSANGRKDIDIREFLASFTTDVIGSCAFGIECNTFKEPDSVFRRMGDAIFKMDTLALKVRSFMNSKMPRLSLKLGLKSMRTDVSNFFTDLVHRTVKYREDNNFKRPDFLQLLIDMKNATKDSDSPFTMDQLAAQVFLFFVAGFDTSSTTMNFTIYELCRNPDIQEKARKEVMDVLEKHDGKLTYESLVEMKYLQQVIDEAQRLYPPLVTLSRTCVKDYKLRDTDIVIEKGTPVVVPVAALHKDPEHYSDPETFDPERFSPENKSLRHPFTHLPFGEGPRNCIGLRFGLMQSKIGLASILRKFRLRISPTTKMPLHLDEQVLLLKSVETLYIIAEKVTIKENICKSPWLGEICVSPETRRSSPRPGNSGRGPERWQPYLVRRCTVRMALITDSIVFDFLLLATTLVVSIVAYFYWSYTYWEKRKCPFIPPKFPLGNSTSLLAKTSNFTLETSRFYDEIKERGLKFAGIYLVTRPVLIIIDPDYIRDILSKDFQYFVNRGAYHNEKDDPLSAHLFAIDEPRWKPLRSKITPTFTSGKMKMMFDTVLECSQYMIDAIDKSANGRNDIDIREFLACFTTDVIGSCAFGIECNTFKDPNSVFRMMGNSVFIPDGVIHKLKLILITKMPKLSLRLGLKRVKEEISTFFQDLVQRTVKYREDNNFTRPDFLQLLIDLKNATKDTDHPFTMDQLAAQVFLFFVAGFDTSSTTMNFTIYELCQNPDVQEKARKEVMDVLEKHDGKLTYESLAGMKYLQQVIDETLRLYTPLVTLSRVCVEDYRFKDTDVTIEKGTPVVVPLIALHRDPDYYPDPEKFDPERFTLENKSSRHPYTHLPFGEGPRNCIGLRFGLMQSKIGLAMILQKFRLRISPTMKMPLHLDKSIFLLKSLEKLYVIAEHL